MNIAQELYGSGLLSHERTVQTPRYSLSSERKSRWPAKQQHPFMEAFQRTDLSPKVNHEGWRTLTDVLR